MSNIFPFYLFINRVLYHNYASINYYFSLSVKVLSKGEFLDKILIIPVLQVFSNIILNYFN